jgi:hypothetical protein
VSRIVVLSPRPKVETLAEDPGPGLERLEGAVIGIRQDDIWDEWDVISAEWAKRLEAQGATVRFWRARGRTGAEGEATAAGLAQFIDDVDLAVVGLGN